MLARCLALSFVALSLLPSAARACAPCGSADPAITFGSLDRPAAERVRIGTSVRSSALDASDLSASERRLATSLSWSPTDALSLQVSLPVAWREVRSASLRVDQTFGLSDLEASARFVVLRDRAFAPEHVVSLEVGLLLPTTIPLRDAQGDLVVLEAQPGRGAWEPRASLLWTWHGDRVGTLAMLSIASPAVGIGDERSGIAGRATLLGWWQPSFEASLLAGLEARVEGDARVRGEPSVDAPLASTSVQVGIALRPRSDLTLVLSLRAPIVQHVRGTFSEGATLELSLVVDV